VLIALGLTTVFGILGIAHFAHGSVSMFGGYLTFFLVSAQGLPLALAIVIARDTGFVLDLMIALLAYRPVRGASHLNAFIVALGLTMMVEGLNLEFFGHEQVVIPTDFTRVFDIGGVPVPELRLYVILAAALLIDAMTIFVGKTKTGQAIRAGAGNHRGAGRGVPVVGLQGRDRLRSDDHGAAGAPAGPDGERAMTFWPTHALWLAVLVGFALLPQFIAVKYYLHLGILALIWCIAAQGQNLI